MKRANAVTVYERESQAGGLLCYGIPNMKLKKSVLNQKIETMKEQGILFENNIEVDAVLAKQLKATAGCCCHRSWRQRDKKTGD